MPTMNRVDMLNCAAGHHDFSDDASECNVCGLPDLDASMPAPPDDGWTAAELQRVRDRANELECLLAQAVEDWPQFDTDSAPLAPGCIAEEAEPVNGGDLVEWFGEWRAKVKAFLET